MSENVLDNGRIFYTDGGCHNESGDSKGVGAWAFIEYSDKDIVDVYCRYVNDTTNNRTEMLAVINAIKHCDKHTTVNIVSDSGYVVKGYNHPSYLDKWIQNNWRTASKAPVQNQDLWEEILSLSYTYGLKFKLVRGHYRDQDTTHAFWNSIVDRACTWVMQNFRQDDLVVMEFDIKLKKFISVNGIKL